MLQKEAQQGRGFLFIPVIVGLGAILWLTAANDPPLILLILILMAATGISLYLRERAPLAHKGTFGIALLTLGALLAAAESWRAGTVILDSAVTTTLTVRIDRREPAGPGRWRYIAHVLDTTKPALKRPPDNVSLLLRGQAEPLATGAIVSGRARLSPPSGPALPGLNDFSFSAYFDGIGAYGFWLGEPVAAPDTAAGARAGFFSAITLFFFDMRAHIGARIRGIVPGDAGAFAAAIVTDERRAISQETTDALRLSGLAHIVAISGLNMALAAGIFFVGVRAALSLFPGFAQRHPIKKIAAAGALVTACAYYLISGFAVSAERAFLMMAILLIAALVDRPSISLRNIALSALVILALSPSEIMGPSFQMSFAATLALVAGYNVWTTKSPARERLALPGARLIAPIWEFVASVFLTSLIGSLSTAVFSVEHFHKLATYGLAANLAAMPIISFVVMPAGLVGMLLMPFGLDAWPLMLMGWGLDIVIVIAKTVAGWGGEIAIGRQPALFLPLAVSGMLVFLLLHTPLRHLGLGLIGLAFAVSLMSSKAAPDLVISEDGTLVAVVQDNAFHSNRQKPNPFIFDQWKRALTVSLHRPPELLDSAFPAAKRFDRKNRQTLTEDELIDASMLLQQALETAAPNQFTCVRQKWCVVQTAIGPVMTLEDGRYIGFACDNARLVITPTRAKFSQCRSGTLILDTNTLRRTGALEVDFRPQAPQPFAIRAAFDPGSRRPWSEHRAYSWRADDYSNALPAAIAARLNDNGG